MLSPFLRRIKQLRGWFILMIALSGILTLLFYSQPAKAMLGVYDPSQDFQSQGLTVSLEHHFVPWRPDNAQELATAIQQTQSHHRIPLITLEPWPWNWQEMQRSTLLQDIAAGKYNETIDRALRTIHQITPQKVLLRWGHEMEIVGQYPWSVADAQAYITAYRYLVTRARQLGIDNIIWIWSPAGNANAIHYWPGEDVVDIVGISIYATPEWHPDRTQSLPSFDRLMQQKAKVLYHWKKPILVAEVGVNAPPQAQKQWLIQAIDQLRKFPNVMGWVYFNQIQPEIVPLAIGRPNWKLDRTAAQSLVEQWPKFESDQSPQQKMAALLAPK
jgi:cellulose synthase (UDP-forming)